VGKGGGVGRDGEGLVRLGGACFPALRETDAPTSHDLSPNKSTTNRSGGGWA